MMFGPIIPLVLFAIPVVVAFGVVVGGIVTAMFGARREVARLPRAVVRPVRRITEPVVAIVSPVTAWIDDEVTRVFDRAQASTLMARVR